MYQLWVNFPTPAIVLCIPNVILRVFYFESCTSYALQLLILLIFSQFISTTHIPLFLVTSVTLYDIFSHFVTLTAKNIG